MAGNGGGLLAVVVEQTIDQVLDGLHGQVVAKFVHNCKNRYRLSELVAFTQPSRVICNISIDQHWIFCFLLFMKNTNIAFNTSIPRSTFHDWI